jgi:hypothetical protein
LYCAGGIVGAVIIVPVQKYSKGKLVPSELMPQFRKRDKSGGTAAQF